MKACFPCVGLVVFAGCFLLVMSPDEPARKSAPPVGGPAQERPVIVIDPGHGGNDDGTRGLYGLVEKDVALDLASRVDGVLRNMGFTTLMTRTSDRYVALGDRSAIAAKAGDHVFVSIHLNSNRGSGAHGFEVFYADNKEIPSSPWQYAGLFSTPVPQPDTEGKNFAETMCREIGARAVGQDRGILPGHLFVLRHTPGPAILVEAGFIDSTTDAALLRDNAHRQAVASAIASGVVRFVEERRKEVSDVSTLVKR